MGRTCEPIAPRFRAWFGMPAIQRVTPALCDQRGLAEVLLLHRRPPPCGPSRGLAVVGEVGRIASNRRVASESGHATPPLEISAELSKATGDITLDSEAGGSVTPRSAREVRCQWGGKARSRAIPGASKRGVPVLLPGVARLSQDRSDEHCCLRPQEFRPNTRYRLERGDISRKSRQSFAGCAVGLTKAALRPIINPESTDGLGCAGCRARNGRLGGCGSGWWRWQGATVAVRACGQEETAVGRRSQACWRQAVERSARPSGVRSGAGSPAAGRGRR